MYFKTWLPACQYQTSLVQLCITLVVHFSHFPILELYKTCMMMHDACMLHTCIISQHTDLYIFPVYNNVYNDHYCSIGCKLDILHALCVTHCDLDYRVSNMCMAIIAASFLKYKA